MKILDEKKKKKKRMSAKLRGKQNDDDDDDIFSLGSSSQFRSLKEGYIIIVII